jgi:hypothetical protein
VKYVAGLSAHSNYVLVLFARASQSMGSALMQPNGLALPGTTYMSGQRRTWLSPFWRNGASRCLPWSNIHCTARSAGVVAMDFLSGLYSVSLSGTPREFHLASAVIATDENFV